MASLDLLVALSRRPLRLAAALLKPPALTDLPPALTDLFGDPAQRLDQALASAISSLGEAQPEPAAAQLFRPAPTPASGAPTPPPAPASGSLTALRPAAGFAASPLLALVGARQAFADAAALPPSAAQERRAPDRGQRPPVSPDPKADAAALSGPAPEQAMLTNQPALRPQHTGAEVPPPAPRSLAPDGIAPASPPPEEVRLVRGLGQLHNLLRASVSGTTTAPPTNGGQNAASAQPAIPPANGTAPHPTTVPPPAGSPAAPGAGPLRDVLAPGPGAPDAPSPPISQGAAPAPPADIDHILDELAERLEIEYLRTYGTSG